MADNMAPNNIYLERLTRDVMKTMQNALDAGLQIFTCFEPVDPEHIAIFSSSAWETRKKYHWIWTMWRGTIDRKEII